MVTASAGSGFQDTSRNVLKELDVCCLSLTLLKLLAEETGLSRAEAVEAIGVVREVFSV